MRVTSIHFRDLVTLVAISGILLLTTLNYYESRGCHCILNTRTQHFSQDERREAIMWLRRVLAAPLDQIPPFGQSKVEDPQHGSR